MPRLVLSVRRVAGQFLAPSGAIVRVNGHERHVPWGRTEFDVPRGDLTIDIGFDYAGRIRGVAQGEFSIPAKSTIQLEYRTPLGMAGRGRLIEVATDTGHGTVPALPRPLRSGPAGRLWFWLQWPLILAVVALVYWSVTTAL